MTAATAAIIRVFSVSDAKGLTSTNLLRAESSDQRAAQIQDQVPEDASANCADSSGRHHRSSTGSDLLAISVKDDFFSASGDECYKIFRTYSVINWCGMTVSLIQW
ncbi:MAG: hypothetical protein R2824_18020 [Saprospiraceae bacterium]